jgi:hypothetical protein
VALDRDDRQPFIEHGDGDPRAHHDAADYPDSLDVGRRRQARLGQRHGFAFDKERVNQAHALRTAHTLSRHHRASI